MGSGSNLYQRCLISNIPVDAQHTVRDVSNFFLVPLNMFLASLSIVSNLLILVAVVRTKSLQHPSLLLLCSLSLTDLLWAVYTVVIDTARITHEEFCPEGMERFAQGFAVLCYISTLGNLAIISKDRHQAVSNPLLYRSNVTRSRVIKKTSGVWVFSVMMWVLVYVSQYFTFIYFPVRAIAVLVYVICIVIIISSYGGILIANKRHRQAMDQRAGRILATLKREKKLAITVGLILIVLCVSFLPALISPLVLSILGFSGTDFIPFRPFFALFISLNGLLNPLLNFGRNADVRRAVLGLIRVPKRAKRVQPDSGDSSQGNQNHTASTVASVEVPLQPLSGPVLIQHAYEQ